MHPQTRILRIERLCDRALLDGAGLGVSDPLPWFDPSTLTYSFAPDGTVIANEASSLFDLLSPLGDASWPQQVDAAFHAWLEPLGTTIHRATDSGQPFGVAGRTQGDVRFGDVRIGAIPLSDSVLATSIPHSAMVQGSWAGDILLNSNASWSDPQQLFAVMVHEFGHVLGLDHSSDPTSVMFIHGVHDIDTPSPDDIQALRDLYAGIEFDHGEGSPSDGDRIDEFVQDNLPPEIVDAVSLQPAVGSTLRYATNGSFAIGSDSVAFRLQPTSDRTDGLENMTIVVRTISPIADDFQLAVHDELGRRIDSKVIHHGRDALIVQVAEKIDPRESFYVALRRPIGTTVQAFELVADVSPRLRLSRDIGRVRLDEQSPVVDMPLSVRSSRLIHLHVDHDHVRTDTSNVIVQLLDATDRVITQILLPTNASRSAPLTFVEPGEYRIRFLASRPDTNTSIADIRLAVFVDELSLDVGPSIIDPTDLPFTACDEPTIDPTLCTFYEPVIVGTPVVPDPIPEYVEPVIEPWFEYSCYDYQPDDFEWVLLNDLPWWQFYIVSCRGVVPTNPTPTNPTPTNPTPTNPTPTNPTDTPATGRSPGQNPRNAFDTSNDQQVTPLDALIVINALAGRRAGSLTAFNFQTTSFLDVNGDYLITPLDALLVINELGRQQLAGEIAAPWDRFPPSGVSIDDEETEDLFSFRIF
ncbi:MAG: matrixin family metalloprotease [Pirellulaceae bacterium]